MRFCPDCGTDLAEGVRFCSGCGRELQSSNAPVRRSRPANSKQLHCPECGSTSISPVVETEITGGTSLNHSFSKRNSISAKEFKNTHRNYWMCSNCGRKFRNIQNLEDEISNNQKLLKRGILGLILCVALALFYLFFTGFNIFTVFWVFVIVLTIVAVNVLKSRTNKLCEERAYLKKNCFG